MPPQQLGAEEPVQGDARAFLGVTDDPLIPSLKGPTEHVGLEGIYVRAPLDAPGLTA